MASTGHTYGPTCLLQAESNTFTRRASQVSVDRPTIRAQFFYCSALPIDDPLSPIPPPSSSSSSKSSKVPPQPFSINDNKALEEEWLKLQKPDQSKQGATRATAEATETPAPSKNLDHVSKIFKGVHERKKRESDDNAGLEGYSSKLRSKVTLPASTGAEKVPEKKAEAGDPHLTLCDDPDHIPFDEAMPIGSEELGNDEFEGGITKRKSRSRFRRKEKADNANGKDDPVSYGRLSQSTQKAHDEKDTSGTPFLRIPSRLRRSRSRSPEHVPDIVQGDGPNGVPSDDGLKPSNLRPKFERFHSRGSDNENRSKSRERAEGRHFPHRQKKSQDVHVPVGVSRLHVVEMPNLKMGPIYWDPVHDVSSVVRGTWFYKETMWPVESELANQIEQGYEYIKPWTLTYVDELNSCEANGAEAELKVVHQLWPADENPPDSSSPATGKSNNSMLETSNVPLAPDEQDRQRAIVTAGTPENRAAGVLDGFDDPVRLFAKSSIIFANARDAQIMQPNQLPSVARGRRPLASIRKGRAVGIPIVRGFDHKAWEKLHPPSKKALAAQRARDSGEAIRSATAISQERQKTCGACLSVEERPKPTDLILVIHGIGQKLSERVESFHFTHSINGFRRQINKELDSDAVKPCLRQDVGGIMALPINWRSKMKFEDGGPEPDPNHKEADSAKNQFNLKDITAESIPAVRNLISDVMLDIPYYLSHHKAKMVEAVVKEANRVYRLWCNNNPGFHETGRVHLVAHSLGSVMALDILSKQPTKLPKSLDFKTTKVRSDIFEFDTKSLFFCGSPAGFFLLLNHAPLLPRKGREKPEADGEDVSSDIAGEAGTFGCLAVDNLYNIMHYNDPIAYKVNACVDVDYDTGLVPASVPSATATWAQYFGSVFKGKGTAQNKTFTTLDDLPQPPAAAKMPSTVEMETHNFSREEIAEKRMYLLNDNGQVDYTLKSGGGPLEIQYLNMLSAHSSYWTLQDFVRFLVVEIGRKPGKSQTVSSIKAAKKVRGKK